MRLYTFLFFYFLNFTDGNQHCAAGDMWNYLGKVQRFSLVLLLLTLQAEVRQLGPRCVSGGEAGSLMVPMVTRGDQSVKKKKKKFGISEAGGFEFRPNWNKLA